MLGLLTNPFTKMRLWLKFELLELEAIFEAMQERSKIERSYLGKLEFLNSELESLEKIERNQFSLSSIFLSGAQKERKIAETRLSIPMWQADLVNHRVHF